MLMLVRLSLCLCASENSIRQISGFVLLMFLLMLTLMLRVFSLVMLILCLFWTVRGMVSEMTWCKIRNRYIHSHSMLLLLFINIFIHIQQLRFYSRNIFIHIERHISYSRMYLPTFTGCIYSVTFNGLYSFTFTIVILVQHAISSPESAFLLVSTKNTDSGQFQFMRSRSEGPL